MTAKPRKIAIWTLVAILVALTAVTGKLFQEMLKKDIAFLILDTEARDSAVIAWAARRVLDTVRPTEADVDQLNGDAGARHIALIRDPDLAEGLFRRFIAQGLDLDARDASGRWTALQMVLIDNNPAAARTLIRLGARFDLRDGEGRDLRTIVAQLQERLPDQDYGAVIALLQDEMKDQPSR